MCDVALGTQTAGSVIRPASFCGVFGFKPTFGHVTTAGVKPLGQSLDTVGWFARDLDAIDAVRVVLTGRAAAGLAEVTPRFGFARTEQWDQADPDCRRAVSEAALRVHAVDVPTASLVDGLAAEQPTVQAYEAARSLAWEHRTRRSDLSANIVEILDWGASINAADYDRVLARAAEAKRRITEVFDHVDVLITPAVTGEAPAGLESTGDPRFCRLWTLLGCPAISVPGATGASGLPIGVQLVGRPGADATLVDAARLLCR
jgi:Asp-tRNA(Asn)/Glu-tRNA(Gln) amidotransferase A subunit family amidase